MDAVPEQRAIIDRRALAAALEALGLADPAVETAPVLAALKSALAAGRAEVAGPFNVVMGLAGAPLSVAELQALGVRRISIGGSLARATFGLVRRAAREMRESGTFSYAAGQIPDAELGAFFASCEARKG